MRTLWLFLSLSLTLPRISAQNLEGPGGNWLSYHGDYTGRRFSSLAQINPGNVANLRAQWVFHSRNSDNLEGTPVVADGILCMTSANDAYALDARTGRAVWHYSRAITNGLVDDASSHHNRGVALWHSRVYLVLTCNNT